MKKVELTVEYINGTYTYCPYCYQWGKVQETEGHLHKVQACLSCGKLFILDAYDEVQ